MSCRACRFELKTFKYIAGKVDVRRFVFEQKNSDAFYELVGKVRRAYKADGGLLFYWKDFEGDFVSISSEDDLLVAIGSTTGSLLKLFVVDANGKDILEEFGDVAAKKSDAKLPNAIGHENQTSDTGVQHPFVTCDECNAIVCGRRFKCIECGSYDLCEKCELVGNRHAEHSMLLIRRPLPSGCPLVFAGHDRLRAEYPSCPIFTNLQNGGPMDGAPWPFCGRPECMQHTLGNQQPSAEHQVEITSN